MHSYHTPIRIHHDLISNTHHVRFVLHSAPLISQLLSWSHAIPLLMEALGQDHGNDQLVEDLIFPFLWHL